MFIAVLLSYPVVSVPVVRRCLVWSGEVGRGGAEDGKGGACWAHVGIFSSSTNLLTYSDAVGHTCGCGVCV